MAPQVAPIPSSVRPWQRNHLSWKLVGEFSQLPLWTVSVSPWTAAPVIVGRWMKVG